MKNNKQIFTIFLSFYVYICFGADIDSMRVCGDKTLNWGIADIDRNAFLCSKSSYEVDTVIFDKFKILKLLKAMNNLKTYETLVVDTKHIDMDSIQSEMEGEPFLYHFENNAMDNKLLIRIYHDKREDWYWVSLYYIDVEYRRCRISKKLMKMLGRYTDLWIDQK